MTAVPALLSAAGVGLGHAVLPDHWVPLAMLSRTRRYSLVRVARLSAAAAAAHVLVSLLLGGIVIVVGLELRSTVERAQSTIVGGILIATGIGFLIADLTSGGGHPHQHGGGDQHQHGHEHAHAHPHDHGHHHNWLSLIVPFGAAASPDLTILPVFLAATAAGTATAVAALVVFAAATLATIVGLTLFATIGGYQVRAQWLERWGNALTAGVLVAIGALVLAQIL